MDTAIRLQVWRNAEDGAPVRYREGMAEITDDDIREIFARAKALGALPEIVKDSLTVRGTNMNTDDDLAIAYECGASKYRGLWVHACQKRDEALSAQINATSERDAAIARAEGSVKKETYEYAVRIAEEARAAHAEAMEILRDYQFHKDDDCSDKYCL